MPDGGASGPSVRWMDRPLPPPRAGAPEPRLAQVRSLSNKGDYEQAARVAEAVLDDGAGDVLALSRYLFGVFLARGFAVLPRALDAMGRAVATAFEDGSAKGRADADLSLGWLCRTVRDRVDFHHAHKDAVWRGWVEASDPALCDAIGEACGRLAKAVEAAAPKSHSLESLASLDTFARGTLRSVVPRPAPPSPPEPPRPAPEPEPVVDAEPELDQVPEDAPPDAPDAAPASPAPGPRIDRAPAADEGDSPAMRLLRRKLDAFATLVERGDFDRAAIVARDVERVVEHFDPRLYLPRLFAPHFRRLAAVGDALAPRWEGEGGVAWRALEQLYLVDLEMFLEGDEER